MDPFYSKENQAHLKESIAQIESDKGKKITKTMDELEEMEKDLHGPFDSVEALMKDLNS